MSLETQMIKDDNTPKREKESLKNAIKQ